MNEEEYYLEREEEDIFNFYVTMEDSLYEPVKCRECQKKSVFFIDFINGWVCEACGYSQRENLRNWSPE